MNNGITLSEREFELLNIVAEGLATNQRAISERIGFSLGMTNFILKRLIQKGIIRAKQLNKRKVEYLLTPKGLAEKSRKTYSYTLKTISSFRIIFQQVKDIISAKHALGHTCIAYHGDQEMAHLFALCAAQPEIREMPLTFFHVQNAQQARSHGCSYLFYTNHESSSPIDEQSWDPSSSSWLWDELMSFNAAPKPLVTRESPLKTAAYV